jgi:hypothetical protein
LGQAARPSRFTSREGHSISAKLLVLGEEGEVYDRPLAALVAPNAKLTVAGLE